MKTPSIKILDEPKLINLLNNPNTPIDFVRLVLVRNPKTRTVSQ